MLGSSLSVAEVVAELKRLRQGPGLAHPAAVLDLSVGLRSRLTNGSSPAPGSAEEIAELLAAFRRAIDRLSEQERLHAEADFNLADEHRHATLTDRQESLASHLHCAAKTVRRRSAKALDSLAFQLLTADQAARETPAMLSAPASTTEQPGPNDVRAFWKLGESARIDIVCSEIPEDERPEYASPEDRNYLRYAKFADLDSLIYLRTRFAQLSPTTTVRDFAPSEYFDTQTDALVVVGGPPWNAKYREFLPELPFHFEPHPLGEDDPLIVHPLGGRTLGPRWTERGDLLADIAVFTRLTLARVTVFLLGGCLTLGVLGAARCFLDGQRGARGVHYVNQLVGDRDFVMVTEARRIGGLTDVADLTTTEPLLVLARANNEPFTAAVDNTERHTR